MFCFRSSPARLPVPPTRRSFRVYLGPEVRQAISIIGVEASACKADLSGFDSGPGLFFNRSGRPTRAHYEKVRKSFYEHLLRITPQGGFQTDFPSAASNLGYLRRRLKASSDAVQNSVDMNLQIMHGNPVFRGTRIPVYQIIEELADGTPLREIPEGYPSLTVEQIQNGLDFAASVLRIYDDQISSR